MKKCRQLGKGFKTNTYRWEEIQRKTDITNDCVRLI